MTTETNELTTDPNNAGELVTDLGSYSAMLTEYLESQKWIGPPDAPLVFHLKKLCQQLDVAGFDAKAAHASAYLQAFTRLDQRRPDAKPAGEGVHPDQTSIFDHID